MSNKTINKEALRERCEKIRTGFEQRNVKRFSSDIVYTTLKGLGKSHFLPLVTKGKEKIRKRRIAGPVFKVYLRFLIEESLEYPIDIYIPYIGLLKIREIDSIGRKAMWFDGEKTRYRFDTPFDYSTMYRIYGQIFGTETSDWSTSFFLTRKFIKPILGKVYKRHPEGGFYAKYIKQKS